MMGNINPNTLNPDDKWFCDHSCGFEPPDDGEEPYACYDCGWEEANQPKRKVTS